MVSVNGHDLLFGYPSTCYGTRRVSHGLPLASYSIRYERIHRLPLQKWPFAPTYWENRYTFVPRPRVDAVHLFNGICVSRVPWISSIEMEFPRYFGDVPRHAVQDAYERMADSDCRLLLPLSDAARRFMLAGVPSALSATIAKKTYVFTGGVRVPPQALQARQEHLDKRGTTFKVGFVGRTFWHKGGPAVLDAVQRLRARGLDVRLLVISELNAQSHVIESSIPEAEVKRTRALLQESSWAEHAQSLTNDEVLMRMAECDVLAFPSLHESLGWVAIEAAGLGIPVVGSNVFAIPEIVEHGVTGFVIQLTTDEYGRWKGIPVLNPQPRQSYAEALEILRDGCEKAIDVLASDNTTFERMGVAARAKFMRQYDEQVAAQRLSTLVREALC